MTQERPLAAFGWNERVSERLAPLLTAGRSAGRVIRVDRGEADVTTDAGVLRATMTSAAKDCVAGDWVAIDAETSRIEGVAPRLTAFVRRGARGARYAQTLAANMDVVAVVQALDPGLNPRRLERELVLAFQSGATPIVVLTKTDAVSADETAEAVRQAREVSAGAQVLAVSNRTSEGLDQFRAAVQVGQTFALLGSSGVGKSTLVNSLAGEDLLATGEIRSGDGKGRHTTTAARLLKLHDGRLLLDTPGVRALALWESWEGLALAFSDLEGFALHCSFADCFHDDEPGCAVNAAVDASELSTERLESWRRLRDEMAELDAALEEQQRRRARTGRPDTQTADGNQSGRRRT
jgi:ribosome biogenesis GTPase